MAQKQKGLDEKLASALADTLLALITREQAYVERSYWSYIGSQIVICETETEPLTVGLQATRLDDKRDRTAEKFRRSTEHCPQSSPQKLGHLPGVFIPQFARNNFSAESCDFLQYCHDMTQEARKAAFGGNRQCRWARQSHKVKMLYCKSGFSGSTFVQK